METDKHVGEYLAPEVEVVESAGQSTLCTSPNVVVPNPFDGSVTEEQTW